jgi:hypothetical protein
VVDKPIIFNKENQNEYFDFTNIISAIRKERSSILNSYQFTGIQII